MKLNIQFCKHLVSLMLRSLIIYCIIARFKILILNDEIIIYVKLIKLQI